MKTIFITILLFFLTCFVFAQRSFYDYYNPTNFDLDPSLLTAKHFDLNGKVESFYEVEYAIVEQNTQLVEWKKIRTYPQFNFSERTGKCLEIIDYSDYGNSKRSFLQEKNTISEIKILFKNDEQINEDEQLILFLELDEQDGGSDDLYSHLKNKYNVIDEIRYTYDSINGKILTIQRVNTRVIDSMSIVYNYDSKHNLILKTSNFGKIVYKYDVKGNLSSLIEYDSEGQVEWSEKNIYNSQNKLIEVTTIQGILKYEYNINSLVKCKSFFEANKLISKTEYQYDSINNLIKSDTYQNGNLVQKVEYTYVYDNNNNWIKCTEFLDDSPYAFFERVIAYYDSE